MKVNKNYKNLGKKPNLFPLREIRKDLNLKSNHNYLIIEGKEYSSDNEVYSNVKDNNCIIHPSGKKEDIVEEFLVTYPNQFAIVDRDYDIDNLAISNLFYTDYNDVECTALMFTNDYREFYHNIPVENKMKNDDILAEIYQKAISLSKEISNINRFIIEQNSKYNKKYKYILNLCTDINNKKINEIIDKNNELNYQRIVQLYQEEYKDFDMDVNILIKEIHKDSMSFRGHDFFIILAYLFDNYKIKVLDLKNEYHYNPHLFLEKKFIEQYAKDKKVKLTKLYRDVINTKQGIFESIK